MPKFQMPLGENRIAWIVWADADEFTRGYVEALFFTNASDPDDECNGLAFCDLAQGTWKCITTDCATFQMEAQNLLDLAYARDYDAAQAGRDFWFTRNGHGVGFWDRKALDAGGLGDALSELARKYASRDVYKGDDNKIYLA